MRKKQNTASSTCCQLCESDVGTWGGGGCCAPSLEGQGLREPGSAQEKRQGAQVEEASVQFSSVDQSCQTLCVPMDCSTPGLPVHHQLPELTQTHVHKRLTSCYRFFEVLLRVLLHVLLRVVCVLLCVCVIEYVYYCACVPTGTDYFLE